jgi:glyoxylase-like metal-dependent hydrolase (beta-lactamase superfamily II)
MARKPSKVVLRSYQVGFGDCFLLSLVYGDGDNRHVLIDFGTTELPKGLKPSEHMPKVAKQIEQDCGGALTAVVATHRHADHISGFGTDGKTGGRAIPFANSSRKS